MDFQIICSGCSEAMQRLPAQSADPILADPLTAYWMRAAGELQHAEGTRYDGCSDAQDTISLPRRMIMRALRVSV